MFDVLMGTSLGLTVADELEFLINSEFVVRAEASGRSLSEPDFVGDRS